MRQPLGVPRPGEPNRRRLSDRREPPLARRAADRPFGRGLASRRGRGLGRGHDFPDVDEDYDDPEGPPVRSRGRKNLLPLYAGLGGAAVLLVVVAVFAARGDKSPPRKPAAAPAARKPAPAARPQPKPVAPVTRSGGTAPTSRTPPRPKSPPSDPSAAKVAGPLDPAVTELNALFRKYGERLVPLFQRTMALAMTSGGQPKEELSQAELDIARQGFDLCVNLLAEIRPIEPKLPLTADEHDLLRQGLPLLESFVRDSRDIMARLKPGAPGPQAEAQFQALMDKYEKRFQALDEHPGSETLRDHMEALGADPKLLLGDLMNQFMATYGSDAPSGETWSEEDFVEDAPPGPRRR